MDFKVLELKFEPVFDRWACKIAYQDEDLLKRKVFKDEELGIKSITCLEYNSDEDILFIRGDRVQDDEVILCSSDEKKQIEEKVDKLNKKYSDISKWYDRVDMKKEYFTIDFNDGSIQQSNEDYMYIDTKRYELGNYFESIEEAKKFLEYFKEFSLKWRVNNKKQGGK